MDNSPTIRELFSDEQFEMLLASVQSRKGYYEVQYTNALIRAGYQPQLGTPLLEAPEKDD